jgi:hypothetical protein
MHSEIHKTDLVKAYNELSSREQWSGLSKAEDITGLHHLSLSYKTNTGTSVLINLISSSNLNLPKSISDQVMAVHSGNKDSVNQGNDVWPMPHEWDLFVEICICMWKSVDQSVHPQLRLVKYIITCLNNAGEKKKDIIAAHKKDISQMVLMYPLYKTEFERDLQHYLDV